MELLLCCCVVSFAQVVTGCCVSAVIRLWSHCVVIGMRSLIASLCVCPVFASFVLHAHAYICVCVCMCLLFVFQYVACFCCTGLAFPPIILDSRALLEVCLTVWAVWHRAVPQRERAYIMAWYNYGMARYIWHCMRAQMWRSIHILSRTDQDHDSSPSRGCTHGRAHSRARQALATATAHPAPSPGVTACAHAHVIVVPILSRTAVSRAGTDQCTRTWLTCAR